MRVPFEKLVEMVAEMPDADWDAPMGTVAARFDVTTERLADAIDCLKMLQGKPTYYRVETPP